MIRRTAVLALLLGAALGCGSWKRVGDEDQPAPTEALTRTLNTTQFYQRLGRLAASDPLPFVGTVAFAAGAARVTVSFDSSFTSCSMDVIIGRLDGNLQRKGLDGVMYQIQSIQVGSKSCSIRDGNVFAGQ